MHVVELSGSPEAIGVGHGRALAPAIRAHLDAWRRHLAGLGIDDPRAWLDELVAGSGFVAAAERTTPDLAAEVAAIADGAEIDVTEAWSLQLLDESWAAIRRERGGTPDGLGCTSFAVVHGARSWSGQTMDLEAFRRGAQAVLRLTPADGPPQIVLTMAGCVGLLGLTGAGFGVLVNALAQVPTSASGLPVALVVRHALTHDSVSAAADFVRGAPHASGQHYLIVGSEQIESLECSPAGLATVMPGMARTWHTNHPLVGYLPDVADAESEARWEAAAPVMRQIGWGRRRSRELLEMSPICRPDDGRDVTTFAAVVLEQSTRAAEFWVTDGPPATDAWTHIHW